MQAAKIVLPIPAENNEEKASDNASDSPEENNSHSFRGSLSRNRFRNSYSSITPVRIRTSDGSIESGPSFSRSSDVSHSTQHSFGLPAKSARSVSRSSLAHLGSGNTVISSPKDRGEQELEVVSYHDLKDELEDAHIEERWYLTSLKENMRTGSRVLAIGISAYICIQTAQLLMRFLPRDGCRFDLDHSRIVTIILCSAVSSFALIALCFNDRNLYYGVLCCLSVYCATWPMFPVNPTCDERIKMSSCSTARHAYLSAVELQCSPQGPTSMSFNLVVVIASPAYCPHYRTTWYFAIFFIIVFILTTVVHQLAFVHYYNEVDCLISLLLLVGAAAIALRKKFQMQRRELQFCILDHRRLHATRRVHILLKNMVPNHIVPKLLDDPFAVIADSLENVSVLFMVIADFDKHVRVLQPVELLAFLNDIFIKIDSICIKNRVSKIETIGEEYVAAVGVEPGDMQVAHHTVVVRLIEMALDVFELPCARDVQIRMGIHTGPIVAGVVGHKLPRFRLFGDTINTAARMMQKGVNGELQFGETTRDELPSWVEYHERGKIEMKGKGEVAAYLLNRSAMRPCTRKFSVHSAVKFTDGQDGERVAARSSAVSFADEQPAPAVCTTGSMASSIDGGFMMNSSSSQPSAVQIGAVSTSDDHDPPCVRIGSEMSINSSSSLANVVKAVSMGMSRLSVEHSEDDDNKSQGSVWSKISSSNWTQRQISRAPWLVSDMTPAQYESWLKHFYSSRIHRKLRLHAMLQALALLLVTTVEGTVAASQHTFAVTRILSAFIVSRALLFAGILLWVAVGGFGNWGRNRPVLMEQFRLSGLCLATLLLSISYNALLLDQEHPEDMSTAELKSFLSEKPYRIKLWTLMFLLLYSAMMINISLRFSRTLIASIVTLGIIIIVNYAYFSYVTLTSELLVAIVLLLFMVAQLARRDENNSRGNFKAGLALDLTNERIEALLNMLLPPMVVDALTKQEANSAVPSHRYNCATVAQSDLVGFTKLASTRQPDEVVSIISDLFGLFDELTEQYDVYKVETVGDAYIAGQAELPLTDTNRVLNVVLFAIRMVETTQQWSQDNGEHVDCRVGVHFGSCTGGIVGRRMQRYHLFGRLLAELELLESTAPEGRVQISKACWHAIQDQIHAESLQDDVISVDERHEPQLSTSKGDVVRFEEVGGGPTLLVRQCKPEHYVLGVPSAPRRLSGGRDPTESVDTWTHPQATIDPTAISEMVEERVNLWMDKRYCIDQDLNPFQIGAPSQLVPQTPPHEYVYEDCPDITYERVGEKIMVSL